MKVFKNMIKCVVITGNKEDPVKVANEMCSLRDDSGKLRFAPEEWRTAKQISSYFSRLAAAQRQNKAVGKLLDEAENIDENDLQTWDNEQRLRELQVSLYDQVDLRHPIIYDGHDICSLLVVRNHILLLYRPLLKHAAALNRFFLLYTIQISK